MSKRYRLLSLAVFCVAIIIRLLLFTANPPQNSFDNHFTPIYLMMRNGAIPAKDACWQCYQPPVFYVISALTAGAASLAGIGGYALIKLLQSLSTVFGILNLWIIYLILKKTPLSEHARLMALGLVSFLPRHIYTSAMHSNDTLSFLLVSLSFYLFILILERGINLKYTILSVLCILSAIFTKYTAFVIIPVSAAALLMGLRSGKIPSDKRGISRSIFIFFLPLVVLGFYCISNKKTYGKALPFNDQIVNPATSHPRAEKVDFFSFKPWIFMDRPVLEPDDLGSFWTLLYTRMWFDVEPKFLYLKSDSHDWWGKYYRWIQGKGPFPEEKPDDLPRRTAGSLFLLGLFPLAVIISGIFSLLIEKKDPKDDGWYFRKELSILSAVLLASNLGLLVMLTIRLPSFASMKAMYLLNSLPAISIFLAGGMLICSRNRIAKTIISLSFILIFILVTGHIYSLV